MRMFPISLLGCVAILVATAAPASQKPCRGSDGKIVACPKPAPKTTPRPSKDEKGRFTAKAAAVSADHR